MKTEIVNAMHNALDKLAKQIDAANKEVYHATAGGVLDVNVVTLRTYQLNGKNPSISASANTKLTFHAHEDIYPKI